MRLALAATGLLVAVLLCFLLLPTTREVLRVESSAYWPSASLHSLYPLTRRELVIEGLDVSADRGPALDVGRLAAAAREREPDDVDMLAGAALLQTDPAVRRAWLEAAARRAPESPPALMALADAYLREASWTRAEEDPARLEELLAPNEAGRLRAVLNQLRRADSDNAVPLVLLAWVSFGERRDGEATALVRLALTKPRFSTCIVELLRMQARAAEAGGLPAFEATVLRSHLLPQAPYARMRQVARLLAHAGDQAKASAKHDEAVDRWLTAVRLGRLMRYREGTAMGILVGNAIEQIGAAPIWRWHRMDYARTQRLQPASPLAGANGRWNGGDIFPGRDHDYFVSHAGRVAAADVLAGLERGQETKRLLMDYSVRVAQDRPFLLTLRLLHPGTALVGEAVLLAVLSLAAAALPWGRGQRSSHTWVGAAAAVALLPNLVFLLFPSPSGPGYEALTGMYSLPLTTLATHVVLVWAVAFPIALAVGSATLAGRAADGRGFASSFSVMLRQVFPAALIVVTISLVAVTVTTAQLRSQYVARPREYVTQGELVGFRRMHRKLFTEPASYRTDPVSVSRSLPSGTTR